MPRNAETQPSEEDLALARQLVAEWDEGRGSSKSQIERRVWGDGGAHGRRFDRFVRQTLGVATSRPSKQTDRIGDLEAQLLRAGILPQGSTLDDWQAQLHHGRHASVAALRAWNDPMGTFRTQTFALLFVAAWNSVAIAVLQREDREWRELDEHGQPRTVDGHERALETRDLVTSAFPEDRHLGLRRNVDWWVGLRNRVAHRHLPALDAVAVPQAQAGLLNLETVLGERFGREYLLAETLSVPLQLSGFRDPSVLASLKTLQATLPLDVQDYLAGQAELNDDLRDDPTYMLRVTFVPVVPSSGRSPDAIAYFVKPGDVPDEVAQALKQYVVLPKVVRAERPNLIATQVVEAVSDQIPFRFTMTNHTAAARTLRIRPASTDSDQTVTDPQYCEWVSSVKRHLYSDAWVIRLVTELSTEDGFRRVTGAEPRPRP